MYLLLGDQKSTICTPMLELLKAEGHNARVIENPLLSPFCFALRLDTFTSASWLSWEDDTHLSDKEIEGVLVCRPVRIPSEGWEAAELSYAEKENRAALLAWLWSLECPVVNRYPAALWFQPDLPLLFWQAQLERCGLSTLPSVITNAEQEADDSSRISAPNQCLPLSPPGCDTCLAMGSIGGNWARFKAGCRSISLRWQPRERWPVSLALG